MQYFVNKEPFLDCISLYFGFDINFQYSDDFEFQSIYNA